MTYAKLKTLSDFNEAILNKGLALAMLIVHTPASEATKQAAQDLLVLYQTRANHIKKESTNE